MRFWHFPPKHQIWHFPTLVFLGIDKALEEQENVCSISMFGLQNSQQIYHEVLCQFVLKNNKAGKIAGAATEVLDGISNIWKSVSSVKEVLQSIAREKELFLLLSKGFDSLHIIVIDWSLQKCNNRNFYL